MLSTVRAAVRWRLLSSAAGSNFDDVFRKGVAQLQKQDFDGAFELLSSAAEGGHVRAQNACGGLCLTQRADPSGAARFFRMAAEQGHVRSMVRLGSILCADADADTDTDTDTAVDTTAPADAAAGTATSHTVEVVEMCDAEAEARQLFTTAADEGDAEAQLRLGSMLLRDAATAAVAAATRGASADTAGAAADAADGEGGAVSRALGLLHSAATGSCAHGAEAAAALGDVYRTGLGKSIVPRDDAAAVKQYRHAASLGHGNAQYSLGAMLMMGKIGTSHDSGAPGDAPPVAAVSAAVREEGERWMFLASQQGHEGAIAVWQALEAQKGNSDSSGSQA